MLIKQSDSGLNSRSLANPYHINSPFEGMLPIMTAPMFSVIDDETAKLYTESKIIACLPRQVNYTFDSILQSPYIISMSLTQFSDYFISNNRIKIDNIDTQIKICIDTANGNMPILFDIIKTAKDIYGDKLFVIAGNVGSVYAFKSLARSGADGIRVGIGGGGGCTTTVHTGVGQDCLLTLVKECRLALNDIKFNPLIIADGISSFIKTNGFHRNGYAAMNILLFNGADIVMVGSILSSCIDSPSEKKYSSDGIFSVYSGMSTASNQQVYKTDTIRHSEGTEKLILCEKTIYEWVFGIPMSNDFVGYVNALKSAMSYTGSTTLNEFNDYNI